MNGQHKGSSEGEYHQQAALFPSECLDMRKDIVVIFSFATSARKSGSSPSSTDPPLSF